MEGNNPGKSLIAPRKESYISTQKYGPDSSITFSEYSISDNHSYYKTKYIKKNNSWKENTYVSKGIMGMNSDKNVDL